MKNRLKKRKRIHLVHKAWAIRVRYPDREFLAGRYWCGGEPPKHLNGYLISAFRTRKEAKTLMNECSHTNGKMRFTNGRWSVVRVEISLRELP